VLTQKEIENLTASPEREAEVALSDRLGLTLHPLKEALAHHERALTPGSGGGTFDLQRSLDALDDVTARVQVHAEAIRNEMAQMVVCVY
jgi:hypothetical protein